jgi:enamine deaminase RidA (YjgF/YER057c/UK114 family)
MPPTHSSTFAPFDALSPQLRFDARLTTETRGTDAVPTLEIALPVLGGPTSECLIDRTDMFFIRSGCSLFETPGRVAGFTLSPAEPPDLEAATRELYRRIFTATAGRRIYRIWNYLPRINAVEAGLENYRRFCRGRSLAFEEHYGHGFQRQLPAASAVGMAGGPLAVAFVAGADEPQHFENPQQIPAFEYPPAYGPRPPSFSRATLVTTAGRRDLFISGTAAIRGHATVAANDLAAQLACTRENLIAIAAAAGAGPAFGATEGWRRTLKVYLRRPGDFSAVRRDLEAHLLRPEDRATYLHAHLCRADLLVEIEAVLTHR